MAQQLATPPTTPHRERFRRRGVRLSRPGLSLMAQGEPMIWLTGGALATCLAMISGLLVLVAWSGLPAFWPGPLLQLQLKGGSTVLGEVTRIEDYSLSRDMLQLLDASERLEAQRMLEAGDSALTRRRLLRTGNFELTGEHYQWVSDFAVEPQGETRPEWGLVVERFEWGRFYGTLREFAVRHPREPAARERELEQLARFVESQRWRVPEEQREAFQNAWDGFDAELRRSRQGAIASFLRGIPRHATRRYVMVLDDGERVSASEPPEGQNVLEVREVATSPQDAWQDFKLHHPAVLRGIATQRTMEAGEIHELNADVEAARLAIRKEELRSRVAAVQLAADLHSQTVLLAALHAQIEEARSRLQLARRHLPDDSPLRDWIVQFSEAQEKEAVEQVAGERRKLEELEKRKSELPAAVAVAIDDFLAVRKGADQRIAAIQQQIRKLAEENGRYELTLATAGGQRQSLSLATIVRAYPANRLSKAGKWRVYADRWWEYLTAEPREANSEGGVLPAIWGTVVMTVVMSMLVVPFGVLAALYLREYARGGWIVSAIRVAISNLAGVPSIVFGVFGLGFFCYVVGAFADGGAKNAGIEPLPPRLWWLTLGGMGIVGLLAFATGIHSFSERPAEPTRLRRLRGYAALAMWLVALLLAAVLVFRTPYFGGLFAASLPNPTLGKGGLVWASLTLALLTLPVVIVATEEALAAVPNSLREGSYACGASKWQTIRRIVLPHAMPGIMTGMILAMARGAGEVAPLMLVGAVKLQPEWPIDGEFPYIHLSRSFMHLGFHLFDLGFQSPNSEAARPLVYVTTLLLIGIIVMLNLAAVWIRSRLRRRYQGGQF